MKKSIIAMGVFVAMSLGMAAQTPDEVDIETPENVQLEMITPAEPVKESKQEIKEREKRMRELQDDVAFGKASNSLRRGYFVLLADNIQFGNSGYRHYGINQRSNFILVQADDGIIQFALNTGSPGTNGLGGWTGKGTVRNKRIKYLKNGDVYMEYQLVSGKVNATVMITLFHNSKQAVADIVGGPSIRVYGEILPYRDKNHR